MRPYCGAGGGRAFGGIPGGKRAPAPALGRAQVAGGWREGAPNPCGSRYRQRPALLSHAAGPRRGLHREWAPSRRLRLPPAFWSGATRPAWDACQEGHTQGRGGGSAIHRGRRGRAGGLHYHARPAVLGRHSQPIPLGCYQPPAAALAATRVTAPSAAQLPDDARAAAARPLPCAEAGRGAQGPPKKPRASAWGGGAHPLGRRHTRLARAPRTLAAPPPKPTLPALPGADVTRGDGGRARRGPLR